MERAFLVEAARERASSYFVGAGVKASRLRPGSALGFGFGCFLTSFLPLSLFPMVQECHKTPPEQKRELRASRAGVPFEERCSGYGTTRRLHMAWASLDVPGTTCQSARRKWYP